MAVTIEQFLNKVAVIKATNPIYRQPGDGSDGTCDCIGLIIGAIRRMGLKWPGIHGTNWTIRYGATQVRAINSEEDLELGDIVMKARKPGDAKYRLPDRYKKGGKYYNGDLNDYYHVGVVTSLSPLNITHMSSKMTVDKKLGQWKYAMRVRVLVEEGAYKIKYDPSIPLPTQPVIYIDTPRSQQKAKVVAPSGRYVKMRAEPSQKCKLYEEVPVGAIVTIEQPGETWAKISWGKRKNWYMMAKFLEIIGEMRLVSN